MPARARSDRARGPLLRAAGAVQATMGACWRTLGCSNRVTQYHDAYSNLASRGGSVSSFRGPKTNNLFVPMGRGL
jgi:hypothetical protein